MSGGVDRPSEPRRPFVLPVAGQRIWVPDLRCPEHCAPWVRGGLATIDEVVGTVGPEGDLVLIQVEGYTQEWLVYEVLRRAQWDLWLKYGGAEMKWDPDACFTGPYDHPYDLISFRCVWGTDLKPLHPAPEPPPEPWQPW